MRDEVNTLRASSSSTTLNATAAVAVSGSEVVEVDIGLTPSSTVAMAVELFNEKRKFIVVLKE